MGRREDTEALRSQTERRRQKRAEEERDRAARDEQDAIDADLDAVQTSAAQYERDRDDFEWITEKRNSLEEDNRQFASLSGEQVAEHALFSTLPVGILIIDIFVFSVVGREIARTAKAGLGFGEWIVPAAIILISASYIFVELVTGFNLRGKRREWKSAVFAVLVWLGVPLIVAGFSLVDSGLISSDPTKALGTATRAAMTFLATTQGIFAIAAHGTILIFGGRILESFGFWFFTLGRFRYDRRLDRLQRSIAARTTEVETSFRRYYQGFHANRNRQNGGGENGGNGNRHAAPKAGPFGARTRSVVNHVFEDEVIEGPPGRGGGNNDAAANRGGHHAQDNTGRDPDTARDPHENEGFDTGPRDPGNGYNNGYYNMDGEDEIRR